MGDRANFGFKQSDGNTIVLYGHWAGHNMLANLAQALLSAESRWTDESYATRIAVSHLIGEEWNNTTGWGLSVNKILDNEHKIPIVDFLTQTFNLHEDFNGPPIFTMDLKAFCEKYAKIPVH